MHSNCLERDWCNLLAFYFYSQNYHDFRILYIIIFLFYWFFYSTYIIVVILVMGNYFYVSRLKCIMSFFVRLQYNTCETVPKSFQSIFIFNINFLFPHSKCLEVMICYVCIYIHIKSYIWFFEKYYKITRTNVYNVS